ncbi:hypothetical protein LX95_00685 [Mesonia algae]|uniref:Uncharacterized protein n=1 Tax=Mesonia algae TaxID=213248 RepID=A0A2W7IBC1_9FLAO|nr:hypothetical protein [Mesonia algae]PZW42375.1 hypothetical protein LX95_00685 [Mesonia algae]
MRNFKFILMFSIALLITSCEEEDDSYLDPYTEDPSGQDSGNNSGSTAWAKDYWKRDNAGTYLDLTSSRPVFCANGEIVGGTYSQVDWHSTNVGYFTLTNAGDVVNFEIRKNGNGLILAPYDPEVQQTHDPANYSVSSSFPCNGNDDGGNENETVAIKFWTNQDYNYGHISVSLNGVGSSQLSGYFSGGPNCNSTDYGGYFSGLDPGTYSYSASCQGYTWSGSVNLQASCTTFQLTL